MYKTHKNDVSASMPYRQGIRRRHNRQETGTSWRHKLCLAGLLCIALWLCGTLLVYAENGPGGAVSNPAIRGADIAKPAVVRIITEIKAQLTVQFPPTTQIVFPQQQNGSYRLGFSGTGTFITSQGDILTADHVVNPLHDSSLDTALYERAADEIAKYINQNAKAGSQQVTHDQVVQQLSNSQLKSKAEYDKPNSTAYLSTDYAGPLAADNLQTLPEGLGLQVDKVKQESPTDEQDIAIIHVPMQDTPTVALATSATVQQQDTLTIIGFPGNGDVSQKPNDLLTSSINTAQVSAKKTNESGAPLIQIAGNIGHGDSGGPALNEQGQIVGIVSFKRSDTDNSGGNATFLQASDSAQAMIDTLQLATAPGPFQQTWNQAFQDYAATTTGHWHAAQRGFDQLALKYPLFKAVLPYQDYARQQAQLEILPSPTATAKATATATATSSTGTSGRSTFSLPAAALAIGGLVGVLLLAVLLFAIIIRPRGKKKPEAVPTPVTVGAKEPVKNKSVGSSPSPVAKPAPAPQNKPAVAPTPIIPSSNQTGTQTQSTLTLKIWPCGHMNRTNARFCSICGEAAPEPPTSGTTLH